MNRINTNSYNIAIIEKILCIDGSIQCSSGWEIQDQIPIEFFTLTYTQKPFGNSSPLPS